MIVFIALLCLLFGLIGYGAHDGFRDPNVVGMLALTVVVTIGFVGFAHGFYGHPL